MIRTSLQTCSDSVCGAGPSSAVRLVTLPSYVPQFDGFRALAIIGVLLFHLAPKVPHLPLGWFGDNGWVGVDLFFVLSGFLITRILLNSRTSRHYFRNFYARRALRIWPLYYAVLVFVFGVLPIVYPAVRTRIFAQCHPWQSYFFYVQNFFVNDFGIGPVGVTWSLAIEEQFYVIWAVVVFFARDKTLKRIATGMFIVSPVVRAACVYMGAKASFVYVNTFCRLDSIALGALVACVLSEEVQVSRLRIISYAGAVLGVLSYAIFFANHTGPARIVLQHSFLALAFAGMTTISLTGTSSGWVKGLLGCRPLRYIGKISYGLYLLHVIAIDVALEVLKRTRMLAPGVADDLLKFVAAVGLTFLLASLSWRFFESPILELKKRFEIKPERTRSSGAKQLARKPANASAST